MKNLMILAAVLVLSGCGLTYDCERETKRVRSQDALAMLQARDVELTLEDGTKYEGRVTRILGDTLELQQEGKGNPYYINPIRIRTATVDKGDAGPSFLGNFFGKTSGVPTGQIDIAFNPTGLGTAVVMEQRGLVVTFDQPIEIVEIGSASQSVVQSGRNSGSTSRGGSHR